MERREEWPTTPTVGCAVCSPAKIVCNVAADEKAARAIKRCQRCVAEGRVRVGVLASTGLFGSGELPPWLRDGGGSRHLEPRRGLPLTLPLPRV